MNDRVLVDTNVWLAQLLDGHIHHSVTRSWLESVAERRSLALCRATQKSIQRRLTTATVLLPYGVEPLTNVEASSILSRIEDDPRTVFAEEPGGMQRPWLGLARTNSAAPKLWMDAYLAAFALTAGMNFVTTDAGFRQFDGLDPLVLTA